MRWWPVVLLVGVAWADPVRLDLLRDRTRHADAAVRAAAAEQLATLRTSALALAQIESAVISDDPAVRAILIDALADQRVLPRTAAIHIPTAAVLARQLPRLYPKRAHKDVPEVSGCAVTGGTERSATVTCAISRCEGIEHVTLVFAITTGVRWTAAPPQRRAVADGSCGDVM